MKCGTAIRPIAITHFNYGTGGTESSRLAICGLNYLPIDAHTHASGRTVAIQAERTRDFARGAHAHLPASRTPVAAPRRNGWTRTLRLDPATTRGMTRGWRRGMAKVWRRRSDEEPDRPPFVMLRGAKCSRSTQAQWLDENREPGSRDYARDDELGTREMTKGGRRGTTNGWTATHRHAARSEAESQHPDATIHREP